jgi:hypothetical protein
VPAQTSADVSTPNSNAPSVSSQAGDAASADASAEPESGAASTPTEDEEVVWEWAAYVNIRSPQCVLTSTCLLACVPD